MFAKLLLPLLFLFTYFSPILKADTRDYYRAMANVAKLKAPKGGSGTGWAVLWNGKKYTVSNAHVCELSKNQGESWMAAERFNRTDFIEIIAVDKVHDLCLLSPMPEADGYTVATNWFTAQPITLYGHPVGNPLTMSEGHMIKQGVTEIDAELEPKACKGEGLRKEKMEGLFGSQFVCVRSVVSVYLSARVYPGNSGSPVIDAAGNVVGVVFAAQGSTNFGYAIPLEDVRGFLSRHLGQENSKSY